VSKTKIELETSETKTWKLIRNLNCSTRSFHYCDF